MFTRPALLSCLFGFALLLRTTAAADAMPKFKNILGVHRGVIAVLSLENETTALVNAAKSGRYLIYCQTADPKQAASLRAAAERAGVLGTTLYVDVAPLKTIHLADNVADAVFVSPTDAKKCSEAELLRVARPRAVVTVVGDRRLVKPVPKGIDEWTHPYHAPDNNPQSNDTLARGALRTQFIGYPKFSPMPEQTVIAGGRIFKAMGHIAHKANQNAMLNTLLCINAYNGTILWKRPLPRGFMIHRNTMVATADALYMGDDESCKVIDAKTGKVRDEIKVPKGISDGPVWKWMGLQGGTLYALVGSTEIKVDTQKSARRGLGHWPWGMWQGHDYKDPKRAFGFGRTIVAMDLKTKKLRWHHRTQEFLDARAVCLKNDRLYVYSPQKFLAALDTYSGSLLWQNADHDLLAAIGPNGRAQHYVTGYATTCYMKCNDKYLFFAGPQRSRLVVASADDGKLQWTHGVGNLQIVLRKDGIYAAGPQRTKGMVFDYATGKVLKTFIARRACTRATGTVDSIFFRATGGTVRLMTGTKTAQHIAPMRPPCQDGVLVSNGHLYWGPWMCGCQLSLYGNIGVRGIGKAPAPTADELYRDALVTYGDYKTVQKLDVRAGDWTTYRGTNSRSDVTPLKLPEGVKLLWKADLTKSDLLTAPVTAGGLVFIADRAGIVRALDTDGRTAWKAYTAGAIYYPPTVANDRLYVGSADGRVYAFEAKTGRLLWTFRVAPKVDRIRVYDRLISRWPVAGGVVVEQGTVYAAAGIAHYDGTHIVALDAVTGKRKASNDASGSLAAGVNSGISIQGNLRIEDGELQFLGGGVYETARFDRKTLKCLNPPHTQATSKYRTAFYPYYPAYGKYVSLEHRCDDGCVLTLAASYEGNAFSRLALQRPLKPGQKQPQRDAANDYLRRRRRGKQPNRNIWQDRADLRFTGFIVSKDNLVAAGHIGTDSRTAFLESRAVKTGKVLWRRKLPALPVKGGTAIDSGGRIYVVLENGQVLCFAGTVNR